MQTEELHLLRTKREFRQLVTSNSQKIMVRIVKLRTRWRERERRWNYLSSTKNDASKQTISSSSSSCWCFCWFPLSSIFSGRRSIWRRLNVIMLVSSLLNCKFPSAKKDELKTGCIFTFIYVPTTSFCAQYIVGSWDG